MRIRIAVAAAAALITLAGCTSAVDQPSTSIAPSGAATADQTPVTLNVASFFTDREKDFIDGVLRDFEAKYPWITVKHTGGQSSDTMIQSIRGNTAPDLAIYGKSEDVPNFCASKTFIGLGDYMARDGITDDMFTAATTQYTSWEGNRCGLPMLSDVYALYYDKQALADAGVEPPTTWAELAAAAEKLTEKNADGSLKRVGFMPLLDYGEVNARTMTPGWNLNWFDSAGKTMMAEDPNWAAMLKWQRDMIDFYGQDQLKTFQTGLGDEFSTSNSFYTGQTPMVLDGEWRVAFLAKEAPTLDYGVVPLPSLDETKYGGGYISGTVLGIPAGSKHQEQAWLLMKYLATDTEAVTKLADGLKNIPTTKEAMQASSVRSIPQFATLIDIAGNPNSISVPATLAGNAPSDIFSQDVGSWQWGTATEPADFLKATAQQIDDQIAQSSGR